MKKTYQKPEAELIKFAFSEVILEDNRYSEGYTGDEGVEEC